MTGSFQVFDTVAVTTNGGPVDSTRVVVLVIVQNAFSYYKMGYASAMSMALPTDSSRRRPSFHGKEAQSPAAQTCGAEVWQ